MRFKLEKFDYRIEYIKTKNNTNADALSCIEKHTNETQDISNLTKYIGVFNKELPRTWQQSQENDIEDESLRGNRKEPPSRVPRGSSTNSEGTSSAEEDNEAATVHTSKENPIQVMPITEKWLNSFDHQIKITFV